MKYVVKSDKSNAKEVLEAIEKETAFFHKILKAFGYEADFCFFEKGNLRLMISTDGSRKYQPKIYTNSDGYGSSELQFEIQTTSYGALSFDEYEKFLESCCMAKEAIIFLKHYDYSTFPEVEFEEK